jgi:ATP-dependent protease HslVU (ClpYQ) peptidase subunit
MTTIAYRDGVLSADSLVTNMACKVGTFEKLFDDKEDNHYGCIGEVQDLIAFRKWKRGCSEKPKVSEDFCALMVDKNNNLWIYEDKLIPRKMECEYYAIGSGYEFALGAMANGASAYEALEAAIKHDCYSGGEIVSMVNISK